MIDAERGWLRRLPNGKSISALGFGVSSLMAKPSFDADRAHAVLDAALAGGINHFDTSPSYGFGNGELRLARMLANHDPATLVVSTKVGSNRVDSRIERGFTLDLVRRSFDASLARLGRDHVDILYLHGPEEQDLNDGVFRFFEDQKAAGRITYSGVNSFDARVLDRRAASPVDSVMLQYNVGDFRSAGSMARLNDAGKIVISGTALARAVYDWRTFVPRDLGSFWYLLRMARSDPAFLFAGRRLARRLDAIGPDRHATAIGFVVGEPGIVSNLFGTASPAHAAANARAGHVPLGAAARAMLWAEA